MFRVRRFRWKPALAVAGFLTSIAIPLLSFTSASAATTCTWNTKTTLTCGGEQFSNPKITGNTINGDVLTLTGTSSTPANGAQQCPADTAVANPSVKTVTITTYTASSNGKYASSCGQTTSTDKLTNTYTAIAKQDDTCPTGSTANKNGSCSCPNGYNPPSGGSCTCPDGTPTPTSGTCAASSNTTCGGGSWDWAICPTDTLFQTVAQKLLDFMQSLLDINTTGTNGIFDVGDSSGNGTAYYQAWNSFRIIGTAVVVIAGLVMVSSQALGFEVFDAYTIRKVLPRLLIAIIAMSLSWPLLAFAIGFFNTLGRDIQGIMYAPFQTLPNHAGLSDGIISWGFIGVIGVAAAAGYGAVLLPILGTGALALLLAILILIVRQIGVTILVITAPLAIACYVLPNTKKVWDLWKDNFLGLMVMYPIVMMFIAAGEIFGAVGKSGGTVQQIVGIVAFFVPYFLIPLAFRMATGVIGTITGMVNDRSKGGFDRLRNARQGMTQKQTENLRAGNAWKAAPKGSIRSKLNKGFFMAGNINQAGLRPSEMRSNMHGFESRHSINAARKMLEEDEAMKMFSGNEDYTNAYLDAHGDLGRMRQILAKQGLNDDGTGSRIYDDHTIDQAISQVRHSRRGASEDVFNKAAVLSLPGTGTAEATTFDKDGNVVKGGGGEMTRRINEVWGNDRVGAVSALVTSRGFAAQARRFDLAGGGTSDQIQTMNAQNAYMEEVEAHKKAGGTGLPATFSDAAYMDVTDEAGNKVRTLMDEKGATEKTIRESLRGQGGSYVAGTKTKGVDAFSQVMGKDIRTQVSTRDQGDGNVFAETVRQYTNLAGRYDSMAGAPPDAVDKLEKVMADKVDVTASMAQQLNNAYVASHGQPKDKDGKALPLPYAAGQMTNREIVEAMRDIPGFLDRRRELGSRGAQNAAMLAATQAAGAPQQPNPLGGGPLPGAMPPGPLAPPT